MKFNYILLALILLSLVGFTHTGDTKDITVVITPSPSNDVAGYKIYWGLNSRQYSNMVDIGDGLIYKFNLFNFTDSTMYYFTATAYDTVMPIPNESIFSNEDSTFIVYTIPDTTAPAPPGGCTIICN